MRTCATALLVVSMVALPGAAFGGQEQGTAGSDGIQVETSRTRERTEKSSADERPPGERPRPVKDSPLRTVWDSVDSVTHTDCAIDGTMTCRPPDQSCERDAGDSTPVFFNGGRPIVPTTNTTGQGDVEGTTIRGTQTNTETNEVTDLGFGCSTPNAPGLSLIHI